MTNSMFYPQPYYSGVTIQIANPSVNAGFPPNNIYPGNTNVYPGICPNIYPGQINVPLQNYDYANKYSIRNDKNLQYNLPYSQEIKSNTSALLKYEQNGITNPIPVNTANSLSNNYPNAYPAPYYLNNYSDYENYNRNAYQQKTNSDSNFGINENIKINDKIGINYNTDVNYDINSAQKSSYNNNSEINSNTNSDSDLYAKSQVNSKTGSDLNHYDNSDFKTGSASSPSQSTKNEYDAPAGINSASTAGYNTANGQNGMNSKIKFDYKIDITDDNKDSENKTYDSANEYREYNNGSQKGKTNEYDSNLNNSSYNRNKKSSANSGTVNSDFNNSDSVRAYGSYDMNSKSDSDYYLDNSNKIKSSNKEQSSVDNSSQYNNKNNVQNKNYNNYDLNNDETNDNSCQYENINGRSAGQMNNYKMYSNQYQPKDSDMKSSQAIIADLNERVADLEEEKKNTKETKIVALTDEYIRSLENYLNNPNDEIRLMASKEILTRLDEDHDRYNDAALNALLNKMLQDPAKLIRIASLSAFASQLACGNDYTVQLLHNIQANPNSDKEDVLQAADILLKMSAGTEIKNIPNPAVKDKENQAKGR